MNQKCPRCVHAPPPELEKCEVRGLFSDTACPYFDPDYSGIWKKLKEIIKMEIEKREKNFQPYNIWLLARAAMAREMVEKMELLESELRQEKES